MMPTADPTATKYDRLKTGGQHCISNDNIIQISEQMTKYFNKIIQQTYKNLAHSSEDYSHIAATNQTDELISVNYSLPVK